MIVKILSVIETEPISDSNEKPNNNIKYNIRQFGGI